MTKLTKKQQDLIRRQLRKGVLLSPGITLPPTETLREVIDHLGIGPGPIRLNQFRAALALRSTPPLYSQDGKGMDAIAYVKLFNPCGSESYYLTEYDPRGPQEAYGYGTGTPVEEWSYFLLAELSEVRGPLGIGLEVDVSFLPTRLGDLVKKQQNRNRDAFDA
jgi:hypothetical protein